eukprot:861417-Prymnesium_polylepis.2
MSTTDVGNNCQYCFCTPLSRYCAPSFLMTLPSSSMYSLFLPCARRKSWETFQSTKGVPHPSPSGPSTDDGHRGHGHGMAAAWRRHGGGMAAADMAQTCAQSARDSTKRPTMAPASER